MRILEAAYELFSRHGVKSVGVNAIVLRSGVARMTLYRHFESKDELVLAFLERRERVWTIDWLRSEVERRTNDPAGRLLAIFDVFNQWFHQEGFEGCSFINALLEHSGGSSARIHDESAHYLARIRDFVASLASDAGIPEADDFARKWHILMKGSIVAAGEGDLEAALRARSIGAILLESTLSERCDS